MSNKYQKFSKAKILSEREQLVACLDYILDAFDRLEEKVKANQENATAGWKDLASKEEYDI